LFAAKLYAIRTLARGACTCRFRGSGSLSHRMVQQSAVSSAHCAGCK